MTLRTFTSESNAYIKSSNSLIYSILVALLLKASFAVTNPSRLEVVLFNMIFG